MIVTLNFKAANIKVTVHCDQFLSGSPGRGKRASIHGGEARARDRVGGKH